MNNIPDDVPESSILKEFWKYIIQPHPLPVSEGFHWKSIFRCIYLYIVVFVIGVLFISPFFQLIHIDDIPHHMDEFIERFTMWQAFLIVVILAPVMEEYIFRFPMKYAEVSLAFILICIVGGIYYWLVEFVELKWSIDVIVIISILFTILFFRCIVYYRASLIKLFQNYYFAIFYGFAIIFSTAHIFNFENEFIKWYFIPVLVFPQFLLALVLGFLRLKYGMWANIMIHGLNNLWPMLMLFASDSISLPGI